MSKSYKFLHIILVLIIVSRSSLAALPSVEVSPVPDYDYTQTRMMVLYGPDGHVFLANPFEHPAPNVGALVYEMILLYVPHLQPFMMPPEQPTHVLDLVIKDKYGSDRLGQRIYIGDPWMSDGKSVALMTPADYRILAGYLNKRYEHGTRYDSAREGELKRPEPDAFPDDWLPEEPSVQAAIQRLPVSDYESIDYDPGAQIRRRDHRDPKPLETEVQPAAVKPKVAVIRPPEAESAKSSLAPNAPAGNTNTREKDKDLSEATKAPDQDKFLPIVFMLLGLLMLTLLLRRQRRIKQDKL